eukprot:9482670-Pyramimonas_sp.AAC.1
MYAPQSGLLAGVQIASGARPAGVFMTSRAEDDREHIANHHWSAVSVHEEDDPWSSHVGTTNASQTSVRASPMDWAGGDGGSSVGSVPRASPISQFGGVSRRVSTAKGSRRAHRRREGDEEQDNPQHLPGKGKKEKGKHKDPDECRGHGEHDDGSAHQWNPQRMSDQAVRDLTSI